jgi:predicted mannosyl-3-phosphoglycerate phosphatase (HAD superfamily)
MTDANRNATDKYLSDMTFALLGDDRTFFPYIEYYYKTVIVNEINREIVELEETILDMYWEYKELKE